MHAIRLMLCSFTLFLVTEICHAVPARRDTITVEQSDGKPMSMVYQGDEYGTFYTTLDGDIMEKGKDGIWRKALMLDKPAARKLLASAKPGEYKTRNLPLTGNPRCLVVLADFPDRKFSSDDSTIIRIIDEQFNKKGYADSVTYKGKKIQGPTGSVKDYFSDQSYGIFTPEFDIIGPIHARNSYEYYGKNRNNVAGNDSENAAKLVKEVCENIVSGSLADLHLYDNDYDGEIDIMAIIFAGRGENYNGSDPNTIWPHQYDMNLIGVEGLTRINYLLTCELFWDSDDIIDGIGIFCHEFSHVLGLPDFYNTSSGSSECLGAWSIMDYGIYDNMGFSPAGYTAFERYSLGWMDIPEADATGKYTLEDIGSKADAFRLSTDDDDKFIILENHQNKGWFRYQKDSGLLVTSVSYNKTRWLNNKVNVSTKSYAVLPADNMTGKGYESGDLYPNNKKDSITMFSSPALKVYDGDYITTPLTGIRNTEGIVSFTIGKTGGTDGLMSATAERVREPIKVFDISGKPFGSFSPDTPVEQLPLPSGIWLIQINGKTKKVRF